MNRTLRSFGVIAILLTIGVSARLQAAAPDVPPSFHRFPAASPAAAATARGRR